MDTPDPDRTALSRRALLGGVAGLAATRLVPTAAATPRLTVMTRNLYVGVDLGRLFRADSTDELSRIAGEMLAEIRSHPYEARMDAIAGEIEATAPQVVGLQEAGVVRVQAESDFREAPFPNASTVEVDLLELLSDALAERGLDYELASSTVTTDVEAPAETDGGRSDVRLTDRTAVLVRSDAAVRDARANRFDAARRYQLRGANVPIERGYCQVDLRVGDVPVTVANTHLESSDGDARVAQARELLDALPGDRPVVVTGDVNSGPGGPTAAYDAMTESLQDAYASLRPDEAGYTCCQASDLRNDQPRLSRRVEHVLVRGGLEPVAVERVGADPDSQVEAEVDGETVRVWPADHAGLVSTLDVTAEAATPSSTATASSDAATATASGPSTRTDASAGEGAVWGGPLYGAAAGVGSVALAALAWYRRNS